MRDPHDKLFHFTLRHPVHAASWLRAALPQAIVEAIDWQTLTPIGERLPGVELRPHRPDGAFVAASRPSGLSVVLSGEHKSYRDARLDHQVLRYGVLLMHELQQRHGTWPLLVALVVRHGAGAHETPAGPMPPADHAVFAEWQPTPRVVVDDLRPGDERRLLEDDTTALVKLTRLCLAVLPGCTPREVTTAFRRWQHVLRAIDTSPTPPGPSPDEAIAAIVWYVLAVTDISAEDLSQTFADILDRPEHSIMSTLERTYQQGIAHGKAEGETLGRAATLLRMLHRRFGAIDAATVTRLHTASNEQLEHWTDRILDAASLDEVFAD